MKNNSQSFACPNCHSALEFKIEQFVCQNCKNIFPIDGNIPDLLLRNQKDGGESLINRASHFDDLSKVYGSSLWGGSPRIIVWLLTRKIRNKDGIGLDVACGTGVVARPMAKKINYVYGVDISMGMVQKADDLSKKNTINNISFARCDSENLPFGDNSFDFVSCSGALHAFPNAEKSLREMQRVLKIGGVLAIMALLEKSIPSVIDPARRELRKSSTKEETIEFNKAISSMEKLDVKLHRFTLNELKMIINKLGFKNFKHLKFGPIIIFSVER
ncbi:MAG: methyltransferase domain-containing protein [Bacteroidales bacterium]|nr:methyltransferase domain-containing protein [Bacteroidales bacterium]